MLGLNPPGKLRLWLRRLVRLTAWAVVLFVVVVLFWLRSALYHRFVSFPREAAAWQAIRAQRQPVSDNAGWNEYRGILHTHSHFSHDSEVPFEEIFRALNVAKPDFICLSYHAVEGRADFDLQWRGIHDAELFILGVRDESGDDALRCRVRRGAEQSN